MIMFYTVYFLMMREIVSSGVSERVTQLFHGVYKLVTRLTIRLELELVR